jgi:hypothetical protein
MTEFQRLFTGRVWSVMGWDQLTEFWKRIDPGAGWYLLAAGAVPATAPADAAAVASFIGQMDALLREDHRESYCGIVYADDLENPRLVKIYDPNNLGSSCGSSKNPPGPGWIMSREPPDQSFARDPVPEGRKRWWQRLRGDS